LIPESYQDMMLFDQCTEFHDGELLALQWEAVDFEWLSMEVTEEVVNGRIGPLKTEYSDDGLQLDPDFASKLLEIKLKSNGWSGVPESRHWSFFPCFPHPTGLHPPRGMVSCCVPLLWCGSGNGMHRSGSEAGKAAHHTSS
jgi:hypothetical protein